MSYGISLDSSLQPMEETCILKKYSTVSQVMSRKYPFTSTEINKLVIIYHKLKQDSEIHLPGMAKSKFMAVLHHSFDMTDESLADRIVTALEKGPIHPSCIYMETWIRTMALFLRGTLDEKIDFCFRVYNISGDGLIGRDTMFHLLKKALVSSGLDDDSEEQVKDMIETITRKFDVDKDGKVSYSDYKKTVIKDPLLLESLGQCLPSRSVAFTFASTVFTPDTIKL